MSDITYYDASEGGGVESVDGFGSYVKADDYHSLEERLTAAVDELIGTKSRWLAKCESGKLQGITIRDLEKKNESALSQLAALREELAEENKQLSIRNGGQSALIERLNIRIEKNDKKLESLVNRNTRLKWQRNGVQLKLDEAQQRLADAERRNAVLTGLLSEITPELDDFITGNLLERLKSALNKPEEAKS